MYDLSIETVSSLVLKVIETFHSSTAFQILLGYAKIHNSFEGFDQFADELETAHGVNLDVSKRSFHLYNISNLI